MFLESGIAGIIVPRLPFVMKLRSQSCPTPETTASQFAAVLYQIEDELIILVASCGWRSRLNGIIISGITKLLQNHRFIQVLDGLVTFIQVNLGIPAGIVYAVNHRSWAIDILCRSNRTRNRTNPMPVVRPDMDADEINLGIGMNLMEEIGIQLTAPDTFATRGYQMVGIYAFNECCLILYPLGKACLGNRVAGEGTGLVGQLPS